MAKFITFEGIDGAGKSTNIDFVANLLRKQGLQVVVTREPGGTNLGEILRKILLYKNMNLETEALLVFAARREHIAQVIEPAMERGEWVISDRFTDSTFAYQGNEEKLRLNKLEDLERWVHQNLQPDVTFLFDIPVEMAMERSKYERSTDKFECRNKFFFDSIRYNYLQRAAQYPRRFRVIDASRTIAEIQRELTQIISDLTDLRTMDIDD